MGLNWNDIKFFIEVDRLKRFNRAARRLGVSHTTVARRIENLEKELGVKLFERSEDGLVTTQEGLLVRDFALNMENSALSISEFNKSSSTAILGKVRIGAPDGFGGAVLSLLLPKLLEQYPEINLELIPIPIAHKLWRRDVDIAITLDRPKKGHMIMRKLVDYDLRLYSSESFFENREFPKKITDLQNLPFVGYVDELLYTDELNFNAKLLPNLKVIYKSTTVKGQLDAIISGIGLGILPCYIARENGLIPVLEDQIQFTRTYWIIYPEEYRNIERIRAVSDYIFEKTNDQKNSFSFEQ